jgi:hypothetical protein
MNRSHHIHPVADILAWLTAGVLVCITGATAALAYSDPPVGSPAAPVRPPLRVHTIVTGGTPGWQITLIAIGTAILAAILAVTFDQAHAGA